jgi:flagellar biosynthetic protein FlhB
MADDRPGGEPTEDPTPRRLRQAREKGQIAYSGDFTSSAAFVAAAGALLAGAGFLAGELTRVMASGLARAVSGAADPGAALRALLGDVARLVGPVLGAAFVAAAVVGYLQSGGLFTLAPLAPRGDKLNPLAGLGRLFSRDALVQLLKALVKIAVVGAVAWWTLAPHVGDFPRLVGASAPLAAGWTWSLAARLLLRVALAYVVIGAADYLWTRHKWLKGQRMPREEVKREYKEQEGDPHHKAERQRMHREILRHAMVESVRTADCVIVNPEHIAVALRYDQASMGAPEVVAKGEDLVAQQIREVARRHGVPIYRDVALARALHQLELGDEIPEALYDAVAEVLRFVQRTAEGEGT